MSLMEWFERAQRWLWPWRRWRSKQVEDEISPAPLVPDLDDDDYDDSEPFSVDPDFDPKRNRWKFEREDVEQGGAFYFKRAILDELKNYFPIIRRLKWRDKDGYDLFSKVGAALLPDAALGNLDHLPPWWHDKKRRPSFGAIWLFQGGQEYKDTIGAKLILFRKIRTSPTWVEPTNDQLYSVTMYHDRLHVEASGSRWLRRFLRKTGFCTPYHVAVDGAGKVRLLKELQTKYHKITYRTITKGLSGSGASEKTRIRGGGHKARHGHSTEQIPYREWGYPEILVTLFEENKSKFRRDFSLERYAIEMFHIAANFHMAEDSGIRVNITQGDVIANFAIDFKRSAYFFRDREATAFARDGKRKRIFHIVRPHPRHLKEQDKDTFVHMHFRGLRDFTWNGYPVHVTVPGWHHTDLIEMTAPSRYIEPDAPVPTDLMDSAELGAFLADTIAGKPVSEDDARKRSVRAKLMGSTRSSEREARP